MRSSQRSFFRKELKKHQYIQICRICNKPIAGEIDWRISGKILKVKRPYHKGCK